MDFCTAPISAPDTAAEQAARSHNDALIKPLGSLGELERLYIRLAGIAGNTEPHFDTRCVVVFAADNGVHAEGISPMPQSISREMSGYIARGGSGMHVLARQANCAVCVLDVGLATGTPEGVIDMHIRKGTGNMRREAAMSREECRQAMQLGFDTVQALVGKGVRLIGLGEMGICNTTTSSAVLSALLDVSPEEAVGQGIGLTDEQFAAKLDCVRDALRLHAPFEDAIDIVAKVGGLDIAAMAGAYIGCAYARIPAIMDGFISTVAALVAQHIRPEIHPYLFASHASAERGGELASRSVGWEPPLHLGMRLGEGSGCPLYMQLMDAACAIGRDMLTFEQANMNLADLVDIRESK